MMEDSGTAVKKVLDEMDTDLIDDADIAEILCRFSYRTCACYILRWDMLAASWQAVSTVHLRCSLVQSPKFYPSLVVPRSLIGKHSSLLFASFGLLLNQTFFCRPLKAPAT